MSMSQCGGCQKRFVSMSLFESHRIGNYGEAVYEDAAQRRVRGYKASTRRCMTADELLALGYLVEYKTITVVCDGQSHKEECEIWYDPAAREKMRAAFRKVDEGETG